MADTTEWNALSAPARRRTPDPLGSTLSTVPTGPTGLGTAAARVAALGAIAGRAVSPPADDGPDVELDLPFPPRHQLTRCAQGRQGLAGVVLYDSQNRILGEQPEWGPRTPLQEVEFGCPWPVRAINPHVDTVRDRALAWMESFGLVDNPQTNAERYIRWMLAEDVAWWHPDASAERLQIAADYIGWIFTPFDDVFDGPSGRSPTATHQICQGLIAVLDAPDAPVPDDAPPRVRAFADLWRRSREGRSPQWRERATVHWRDYFAAQVAEVTNRAHGRVSTLRQLVVIKCGYPIFDMIEIIQDFETPPVVWHSPLLAEIRERLAEVITATNDLVSADKEAETGDHYNNLLLIAENRDGQSRPQAFTRLQDLVHSRFARVLDLEKQLGDTDELLTPTQRHNTRRYLECLHDIAAGDNRWERTSGRYRQTP